MSQRALALQSSGWQGVFNVTGGGSRLISELLTTPGASQTVLEVSVPYAGAALAELLGQAPEQACSASTARALAMGGLQRAQQLGSSKPFGLGCTAGLATNRVKRGKHRAHIAVQTLAQTLDLRFDFDGTRQQEEAALLECLWHALAQALQFELPNKAPAATDVTGTKAPSSWQALLAGTTAATLATPSKGEANPKLLLPGSFNPLHNGHRSMLALAEKQLQVPGAYELSIANVDKPTLDYSTIKERLAPFRGHKGAGPLWLTTLPTFIEKARQFPGATFVVGIDTLIRIAQPRYYAGTTARNLALKELTQLQTQFLVFGRVHNGKFTTMQEVKLPKALRVLCTGIKEQAFREDISSTALRNEHTAND